MSILMQMHPSWRHAAPLLLLVVLATLTAFVIPKAFAQSEEGHVKYRKRVMRALSSNMGALGDILKCELPQRGNIAAHARNINSSAPLLASAYRAQVTTGRTDAKAEIWKDAAGFEAAIKKLQDASAALAKVAAGGDASAALAGFKGLSGTCKACHEDFRKPKEASYRRR